MTERTRLISYVLYGLFINDLNLRSIKTNNWSADNLKKTRHLNELYSWACNTAWWHWAADTLFDNCQLAMKWVSIRLSTALDTARNTRSLLENSQSQPAYHCSRAIKCHIGNFWGVRERNRRWGTACFSSPPFRSPPPPSTLEKPDARAALQFIWRKW